MADKRSRATRAACAALAVLLLAGVCVLIATHLRPDHNVEGLALDARPVGSARRAPMQPDASPELQATGDINVNTATAEELTQLKGVGEKLAEAIVTERETNGRFTYVEDLLAVKGIGRSTLLKLLPQIRLE